MSLETELRQLTARLEVVIDLSAKVMTTRERNALEIEKLILEDAISVVNERIKIERG